MYTSFFKLERDPFEVSPDPYFLYPTAHHNEALAGLSYGIRARKGFMVLTGEVGTGKTLILRCLLDLLAKESVSHAYVFNSLLSSREFLAYVAEDLGVARANASKSDLLLKLNWHLMDRYRQGLTTALVVDEAQNLTRAVLEEIRLLTNLETPDGKLLQIVLVGQPEVDAKLDSYAMRQLKQRIALRFRLEPLSESQTQEYIRRRLELAGNDDTEVFWTSAVEKIFKYSRGIPRLVNVLCDNALLNAYALDRRFVTAETIDEVASDLRLTNGNGNHPGVRFRVRVRPRRRAKRARRKPAEEAVTTVSQSSAVSAPNRTVPGSAEPNVSLSEETREPNL